jgi:hypothetical protein
LQVEKSITSSTAWRCARSSAPRPADEEHLLEQRRAPVAVPPDQQVLQHRRAVEKLDVLEGPRDAQPRHLVRLQRSRSCPSKVIDPNRRVEARDHVEDGGFARAVRPDQREDLALLHRHRQVVDRGHARRISA